MPKRNKIVLLVFSICILLSNAAFSQFSFGLKSGLVLSQVEGDNLVGFKKFGYDIGLHGGYVLETDNLILMEFGFSNLGSNKKSDPVPRNSNQKLTELNIHTINIFAGYSFMFGDNWDGSKDYRFTSGLKFHKIFKSEITNFDRQGLDYESDSVNNSFVSLKFGPGYYLSKDLVFDFFYEHALSNLVSETSETSARKLIPFNINFSLSYFF